MSEMEIKVTDDGVTVKGCFLAHNEYPWAVKTNRHTTTGGQLWGWIGYGVHGEVRTWSNDEGFDKEAAAAAVSAHNRWLEDIQPVQVKLIKARRSLRSAEAALAEAKKRQEKAEYEMTEARERVAKLYREQAAIDTFLRLEEPCPVPTVDDVIDAVIAAAAEGAEP